MIRLKDRPVWVWGMAAGILALGLAVFATSRPLKVLTDPSWHDQGIRLYRDDVDLKVYFDYSRWAGSGHMPYTAGYEQAYPPLAAAYFAVPRLFTDELGAYRRIFPALNAILFGVLFGFSVWFLRRSGRPAALAALLLLPASMYFSLWRYDVLPAVLVALLVWSVWRERYDLAFYSLALAVAAKFYPALFFVPLFMVIGAGRLSDVTKRRLVRSLVVVLLAAAALAAALVMTSGSGFATETLVMHLTRKFEIGSLATVLIAALEALGIPADPGLRVLSLTLVLLQWAALVMLLFRGRLRDRTGFIRGCLFILMPLILFNRFYSQQWVLWITPLYLPVARRREVIALVAFDLLNFFQFPVLYGIDPFGAAFTASTLIRSAILGCLIWMNYKEMTVSGYLAGSPGKPAVAPAAG